MQNNEHNSSETSNNDKEAKTTCSCNSLEFYKLLLDFQNRPFRKRHPILFWTGILILMLITINIVTNIFFNAKNPLKSKPIAVVRVEGIISDVQPIIEWIDEIYMDNSVKAVLLRIDSPGGGVAESYELYQSLDRLAQKKPMIAYMGTLAASGGLMVAMAAPQIVANPAVITGSIGVKMGIMQVQGLMQKIGIGQETLTTGEFKDATSPYKPLTEAERKYLQIILDDMHSQFVELIAKSRKMSINKVKMLADGRIFTGRTAKTLGIVDELGSWEYTKEKLAIQINVDKNSPLLEDPARENFYDEFILSMLGIKNNLRSTVDFMYLY